MLNVIEVPVTFPQISQIGSPPISGTQSAMAELRLGTKCIQESFDRILASLPPLMKSELFGFPAVTNRFQSVCYFGYCLIPGNPFPFSLATGSDSS